MARGSIKKRSVADGSARYDAIVDLGSDPDKGTRRQRKRTFTTRKEAQAALTAWLAEIDKGTVVDRSPETIAALLRAWLDDYAQPRVSAKTLEEYTRIVERHIIPSLGAIEVQKLTPARLQQFYTAKRAAGCGSRTLQLCHLRIAQALKYALRLGLVARNVAEAVDAPRVTTGEMQTWDAAQARRFLDVALRGPHGALWAIFLATGMRRGEVLGLRWRDVDFGHGTLAVRQTVGLVHNKVVVKQPKTAASRRTVSVDAATLTLLREHKARQNACRLAVGVLWQDHDLVFCTGLGTPIYPDNLKREFARLVAVAGVPRIRLHDLRHTSVTLAIASGANVGAVSRRVGHARPSITMNIYAHVLPEQHQEVADKLGAALYGTAQGAL